METSHITNSVEETIALGSDVAREIIKFNLIRIKQGKDLPVTIVKLIGDLGAGKTHFTKGLGKGLGISEVINSPSYTYMGEFDFYTEFGNYQLIHVDGWRVESPELWELLEMENYMEPGNIFAVEWPKSFQFKVDSQTPLRIIDVYINDGETENQRRIEIILQGIS